MATLVSRINDVIAAIGADIKSLFTRAMPSGGAIGQALVKNSNSDYDASWQTVSAGSSTPAISPFLLMGA